MTVGQFLKLFGLTTIVFFAIDLVWIGVVASQFLAYATFDLTCLALFKDFPVAVVVVDMIWGTCLSAVVTGAGYGIGRWLGLG